MTSSAPTVAPRARRRAAIQPRSTLRPSGHAYCSALACGSRIARTNARAERGAREQLVGGQAAAEADDARLRRRESLQAFDPLFHLYNR